jgi:hypothetical protein
LFSWIIADSNLTQLEAVPQESFRDLSLPIEQTRPERRSRFDALFEASECHSFSGTHSTHLGVVSSFMFLIGLSACVRHSDEDWSQSLDVRDAPDWQAAMSALCIVLTFALMVTRMVWSATSRGT